MSQRIFEAVKPGRTALPRALTVGFESPEPVHDLIALGGGGRIAPQLGRADDLPGRIEGDESVLLAAHANGLDFGGDGFGLAERPANRAGGGITPGVRVLLLGSGRQIGDEVVLLRRRREDFALARVHDHDLGGLGAAVNAEQKSSHDLIFGLVPTAKTITIPAAAVHQISPPSRRHYPPHKE